MELGAPALNISAGKLFDLSEVYGYGWRDDRTGNYPWQDYENQRWISGEEMYDSDYVQENGKCQPATDVSPTASYSSEELSRYEMEIGGRGFQSGASLGGRIKTRWFMSLEVRRPH